MISPFRRALLTTTAALLAVAMAACTSPTAPTTGSHAPSYQGGRGVTMGSGN